MEGRLSITSGKRFTAFRVTCPHGGAVWDVSTEVMADAKFNVQGFVVERLLRQVAFVCDCYVEIARRYGLMEE